MEQATPKRGPMDDFVVRGKTPKRGAGNNIDNVARQLHQQQESSPIVSQSVFLSLEEDEGDEKVVSEEDVISLAADDDDDDDENCDLDEHELHQFTQNFTQQEDVFEDEESGDDSHNIDLTQDVCDFSSSWDDQEPDSKRPRVEFNDSDVKFNDSDERVYLDDTRGTLKIFKVGESFTTQCYIAEPKRIYTIVKLLYDDAQCKKAICRVSVLVSDTFIGEIKGFAEKYGSYVSEKFSKDVLLRNLKFKLPETPTTKVYIDPPAKEAKGVGWTIGYGFIGENLFQCPSKGKKPVAVDLFAGVGGMSQGLAMAGFDVR
jgi:hypothetical protein